MATNAASTNNILLQKDKEALKSHLKSWKNNLNERKQGYWSYLRTENLIKKYEEWCSNDPAIIPRKYTPKLIESEPEEQKEIRMRYAKNSMKCDMEIMKLRITNFQSKYEAVDEAMISEIEANTKDQITKATLIELWKKECQEQEEKSKEIWKEKEEWLLKIELEQTLNQNYTKEKQNNYRSNEGGNSPEYFNHEFPSNRSNRFRRQQQPFRSNRNINSDFWQDNRRPRNTRGEEEQSPRAARYPAGSFLSPGRERGTNF